jgi:DNA-binding MarR family transcriptional regulator
MGLLGGITPKTLTLRLKELEADGLVEAQREPGRREVWYRLTPAGHDLGPALEELLDWGLRHAVQSPAPGEPSHPLHVLWALRVLLDREGVKVAGARWAFRIVDDGSYLMTCDAGGWTIDESDEPGEVTVVATKAALVRFLTTPPPRRTTDIAGLTIEGPSRRRQGFLKAIDIFPAR